MFFKGTEHKKIFTGEVMRFSEKYRQSSAFMSALFLLTSNKKLWRRACHQVRPDGINFDAVHVLGESVQEYTLLKMAQDLYSGTTHVTIHDLYNPQIIDNESIRLINSAITIRRYGIYKKTKRAERKNDPGWVSDLNCTKESEFTFKWDVEELFSMKEMEG